MRKLRPSTIHILRGLIPYTKENIELSFKPSLFFNELEEITRKEDALIEANTFKQEFYRCKKKGLLTIRDSGIPKLTSLGKLQLSAYQPVKLKESFLLLTFDIEERQRAKRDELRTTLRILKFRYVQKSVWVSRYDSREFLTNEIKRLGLENSVNLYEAHQIIGKK